MVLDAVAEHVIRGREHRARHGEEGVGCRNRISRPGLPELGVKTLVRRVEWSGGPAFSGGFVFLSLCYVVLKWLLQLAVLRTRSNDFKDLEIAVLRHELAVLLRSI